LELTPERRKQVFKWLKIFLLWRKIRRKKHRKSLGLLFLHIIDAQRDGKSAMYPRFWFARSTKPID